MDNATKVGTLLLAGWQVHYPNTIFHAERGVCLAYNGVGGEVTWLSNITQMHCNRTWQDVPEPYVAAFFDYIREKGWIS